MLHLDQLAAFDRVAREGSFSRAAVALGLGQPAVSARILALEEAVGGALFVRARRIRLTALGESFLPFARRALEVVREGVAASRLAQVGERGPLRIGALGSLAGEVVGPALAEFIGDHPHVDCTVRSGHHEFLLELLADGIVDAALTVWPPGGTGLELQPIFKLREKVVLVTAPGHPLARRREVRREEVVRLARPLLRLRWWRSHHQVITALADESRTSVEIAMETARRLVLAGTAPASFRRSSSPKTSPAARSPRSASADWRPSTATPPCFGARMRRSHRRWPRSSKCCGAGRRSADRVAPVHAIKDLAAPRGSVSLDG